VASESAFDYFASTRAYLERYGKPIALYSDKASIFRVSASEARRRVGITQFSRALSELNIDLVYANSPQAKGRVERAHLTLQDRLVKELRLRGISTPEAGNAYLPEFQADHNARLAASLRARTMRIAPSGKTRTSRGSGRIRGTCRWSATCCGRLWRRPGARRTRRSGSRSSEGGSRGTSTLASTSCAPVSTHVPPYLVANAR
jgi:hypothetical protein